MAYSCEDIQVLSFHEAVRKRPGMYFGGTDRAAMHELVWDVIGNAVDEYRRGHGTTLRVAFDGAEVMIEDDGRGIPVDPARHDPGVTVLELVLTTGHWRSARGELVTRLGGAGLGAVNAVCERFEIDVWRDGRHHVQRYARGVPRGAPRDLGATSRTGTRIRFVPDATVFDIGAGGASNVAGPATADAGVESRRTWDRDAIAARLRAIAAMAPGLTIDCDGERFHCPRGLADRVRYLARERTLPRRPIELRGFERGVSITAALAWSDDERAVTEACVGMLPARGTHVDGFVRGVFGAFARLEPELVKIDRAAVREVVERGLVAVLHVELHDARFTSQSRTVLTNPEVAAVVAGVVRSQLAAALLAERGVLTRLFSRTPRIVELDRPQMTI